MGKILQGVKSNGKKRFPAFTAAGAYLRALYSGRGDEAILVVDPADQSWWRFIVGCGRVTVAPAMLAG
jgi:hypothetical protein